MTPDVLQHVIVTLVAASAFGLILRRATGFLFSRAQTPTCASCASGQGRCGSPAPPNGSTTYPVVVLRTPR